ncbi:glycosyltransferase involved in cell wall biosynthesis [Pontibacter ummariensis]|uniref:Glycosyltransferase involved in cell wall bisynthesis n=1 Tax=Pontibacter ummariensis TaxID=1610492 RepID=A0A239GI12_9BACT|nr:glycosyltransferase [Pontibacter ummariensis]PRY11282.1 glycosyltransferase involved in cell wall biosynthesis [Pontibacter ummariensis]SNS68827.1 Glycosyltransferase involved in cell wall bisynthesis [Pontibacter ummariensis]
MGDNELLDTLQQREQFREHYWHKKDPILQERLLWRAQTFRQLIHLLPGQSILELGCGSGVFTRELHRVSKSENPITAVTFQEQVPEEPEKSLIEFLSLSSFPGPLQNKTFDHIIIMDLVDETNSSWFLENVYALLKPGGQVTFYESNPKNPFLKGRNFLNRFSNKTDRRKLLSRSELSRSVREAGFVNVVAVYNDFVYAPLTPKGVWWLRNLSTLLENLSPIDSFAGAILLHAQKAPQETIEPNQSLCQHKELAGAVSVVVPCHNEEMNITSLVTGLLTFYGDYLHEIILVDDNSKDNTRCVIEQLAEKYPLIKPVFRKPPNGVGRAIRDGYRVATGKYILSMDCDFQHLLPELRDIFNAAVRGVDVAIGSRFSRRSVLLNYPFQKIIANRGFHFLARLILGKKFRDLTNNLKLIRKEVVDNLQLTQTDFAINAETGLMPLLMGYRVREVPISWVNRTPDMGVSSFKLFKVGGGYWRVLYQLWVKKMFNNNSYYPAIRLKGVKKVQLP